jgi:hypothetical protein
LGKIGTPYTHQPEFLLCAAAKLFFLPFGDGSMLPRFANNFYLRICVGIKFVRANALNLKKYEIT